MPEPKFHQKIAWFNFICCLMVIWTHSGNADLFFPELGQDAPWWHFQYPVMQEILRVDIPCFIMLSAYLFYRNFTMKRLGEKLNKRLHSLLVPYLLWNTIYYVAYVAASRIPGLRTIANRTDLVITTSGAWQAITKYTFNPVFWFMYQIILLVLLAPVLEEWIFRKLILRRLAPWGEPVAIFGSAFLFGLFHGNFGQFFYAFAVGAVFAYVALRTGGIRYTVALHFLVNLLGMTAAQAVEDSLVLSAIYGYLILAITVVGCVILWRHRKRIHLREGTSPIPAQEKRGLFLGNSGMIAMMVLSGILMLYVAFLA